MHTSQRIYKFLLQLLNEGKAVVHHRILDSESCVSHALVVQHLRLVAEVLERKSVCGLHQRISLDAWFDGIEQGASRTAASETPDQQGAALDVVVLTRTLVDCISSNAEPISASPAA